MLKVVLVDDHAMVRRAVRMMVESLPHIAVVGEAASVADAQRTVVELKPHVAVLDVSLPDGSGIDLCATLRRHLPTLVCLMYTAVEEHGARDAAARAGAEHFLLKSVRGHELTSALNALANRIVRRP